MCVMCVLGSPLTPQPCSLYVSNQSSVSERACYQRPAMWQTLTSTAALALHKCCILLTQVIQLLYRGANEDLLLISPPLSSDVWGETGAWTDAELALSTTKGFCIHLFLHLTIRPSIHLSLSDFSFVIFRRFHHNTDSPTGKKTFHTILQQSMHVTDMSQPERALYTLFVALPTITLM